MSSTDLTASEAFSSLNYYEIQELKNTWQISMNQLESLAVEAMYALIWIVQRRTNANVDINAIKSMPFTEVSEYFAEEDPGDLEGKDEAST